MGIGMAQKPQVYNMYENWDFGTYEYEEYPKQAKNSDGTGAYHSNGEPVVLKDEKEEEAWLAKQNDGLEKEISAVKSLQPGEAIKRTSPAGKL